MEPHLRKLDSATREALREQRPGERLDILVRVDRPGAQTKSYLSEAGMVVHSLNGPIASGVIEVHNLARLAALTFVMRIESSRSLFSER